MTDASRKLRTVIVDDEPLARRLLRSLLDDMAEIELVAECRNGREAIQVTRSLAPDLLILDIQMPGTSGFDVVQELQADIMPAVIFCTAFQRYAVDAFDLHAVDYLLKPVGAGRLERAVARAQQRLLDEDEPSDHKIPLVGAIDEIAGKVSGRSGGRETGRNNDDALVPDRKIAIRGHDSTVLVEMEDIDWVDAAGDYMCVHVKGETLIMRSTLKDLISRLDAEKFKQIHRSTIVNLERIVRAVPLQKGEYMLELDCDQELKVSRNYRQAISLFLNEH